ncbi:DEKNAAC102714 [Brettanomyces naardenensis]|uniref:DEKNAAC102714 n=1 Tax=Brettanomyces naardenensis TaxID=13370 RepID=A0A448YLE1_BRENA|nr:DEKNAAC102714 [Brettanomyces naardenensis]
MKEPPNLQSTPIHSHIGLNESSISTEIANESVVSEQEELYGEIRPAPEKLKEPTSLPVLSNGLVIPRKRPSSKVQSSAKSPATGMRKVLHGHVKMPIKQSRNFTSPLPRRIPSLAGSPIPDLSPSGSVKDGKYGNILSTPVSNSMSPLAVRSFSSPSADLRSIKIPLQVQLNQLSKESYVGESERELKRKMLKYKGMFDKLEKIKKQREGGENDELDQLIDKWRDAARAASNYMLNEARLKINKMGGIEEYRRKQQTSKLRKLKFQYDSTMLSEIEEYMNTEKYKNLDTFEKQEVIDRKREIEKISEKIENGEYEANDEHNDSEFSMKELFGQLHLDYDLVWGAKTD